MRAYEIVMFLLILNATIGMVNEVGLFQENYIPTPQNEYTGMNLSDLNESIGNTTEPGLIDIGRFSVSWIYEGFVMFVKILISAVIVYPTMVHLFHIPSALAAVLQTAYTIILIMALIQFKTKRSFRYYE